MKREVEKAKELNVITLELGLTRARCMCVTSEGYLSCYSVCYKDLECKGEDTSLKRVFEGAVSELLKQVYQDTKKKKILLVLSVPVKYTESAIDTVSKLQDKDLTLFVETEEGKVELDIVKVDVIPNAPVPEKIDIGNLSNEPIDIGREETIAIGDVNYQVSFAK